MAEKEERILIQVMDNWCQYRYLASVNHLATDGSVISNDEEVVCHREDNWGELCDDKCCEQCKRKEMLGISRQEAIEGMAKGIHFYEWGHHNNMPKWEELNTDIQNDYKNMAEAALNALLDG